VLRVIDMSSIELFTDRDAFERIVDEMYALAAASR